MNDTQLYPAIGIPSFLVVLAWITSMIQTSRIADQNVKLSEKLDRSIEQLSAKVDRSAEQLSAKVDRSAEQLVSKVDRLAEQQHKDALNLMGYMVPLHERLAGVEAKQGAK
jgi:CRISPR/Cas system CMR subunit Cmr4 (Cas7 group RAMP superfamily)